MSSEIGSMDDPLRTVIDGWFGEDSSIEEWTAQGLRHRLDGPAYIHRKGGVVIEREWCVAGKRHRLDGPAVEVSDEEENVVLREWWVAGTPFRIDGPAIEARSATGELEKTVFRIGDRRSFGTLAEAATEMALRDPEEIRIAVAYSGLAHLIEDGADAIAIVNALAAGVSLEGLQAVIDGAPPEWVRAFEDGFTP